MTLPHHTPALATVIAAAISAAGMARPVEVSWTDRVDGPASMNDYGHAVAIGADGSAYVAGLIFEEVSPDYFAPRFMTMRYDPTGARMWTRSYHGTFATGAASAEHIAIDGDGNIIVSGSTNQGDDWAVLKYDPDGTELWRRVYEADSTFLTSPDDMTVDTAGNVYLAGYVGDPINPPFGAVVKVTAAGVIEWEQRYYGPLFDGANFAAVAVDDAGNVYAGGAAGVTGLASELTVVKYDANGNYQWFATAGSMSSFAHDRANDLAIDGNGDIIAVGSLANVDIGVVKFDGKGTTLWATTFEGPTGTDAAGTIAIDSANDIIVAGYSAAGLNDYDALTLKYDAAGALVWERRVAGDEIHFDYATSIAIDPHDNVYVSGTYDPIGGSRFFATRYAPDGAQDWFMDYAGPLGGGSRANAIAIGPEQSVCVTGESPDVGSEFDITTIRYTQPSADVTGDITGDGFVGFDDLLSMLAAWGPCDNCAACPADFDDNCAIDFADLLSLLASWS